MVRLQTEPIDVEALIREVRGDEDGAVAVFLGTVRNHNRGRRVLHLDYHAYPEMALSEMREIERRILERFPVSRIAVAHRTGHLEIGETSVAVAASSPHRADAFRACREAIDTLKRTVPIWKKEVFEGGEAWVGGSSIDN
jgi:molybdopterin synthase catalytic subunit